jgi:hypothetical protein
MDSKSQNIKVIKLSSGDKRRAMALRYAGALQRLPANALRWRDACVTH